MIQEVQHLILNKGIGEDVKFYGVVDKKQIKGTFALVDLCDNETLEYVSVQIDVRDKATKEDGLIQHFIDTLYYCDKVIINKRYGYDAIHMVETTY